MTQNWGNACRALANYEWARDVMGQNGPRTSRLIREAKAALRLVEKTEPPVMVSA